MVYLQQPPWFGRPAGRGGHLEGRDVMFVRVGLGECAIILLLLLIVIAIVALGVRQRRP